jgi:ADP-ribosylglycohydrolase
MLGAIAGDIIGSVHEGAGTKSKTFPLFAADSTFTDDTVLTVAVADCLLNGGDFVDFFHKYYHNYPDAGYGGTFARWASFRERQPYLSWGNGSAMRVSPVAYVDDSLHYTLEEAKRCAEVTHNHPEGIRGAQATAAAIYLARTGSTREQIRQYIEDKFGYVLDKTITQIRPTYGLDVSCQGSVPQSIIAFLDSSSYEDAVRNAISLGGDADTMACIAGGIAEAYYGGIPDEIRTQTLSILDDRLRGVVEEFIDRYGIHD